MQTSCSKISISEDNASSQRKAIKNKWYNVVNVPADVNTRVNILPGLPHKNGTIEVQLKRKLQYNSSALSLGVRPHKVIQTASWLANALFQQEGITVNQTWGESLGE